MSKTNDTTRAIFTTRIGAVATAVGSAVGLGNIWRFPFEAGSHGGGAFMACYLVFIIALGIPVICAEFILGRHTRSNETRAFRTLAPGTPWHLVGYIGILASILILSFYSVVAGWTLEYLTASFSMFTNDIDTADYHTRFGQFISGNWRPVIWTVTFLAINFLILLRGVRKGIERLSNILMPVMFLLLVIFCVNSLLMPKASEGLYFLFHPDFSQITPSVLLGAMGQAFFSLSIGLGCMMTYGSYFSPRTNLLRCASVTAILDTGVAILAGIIIFPAVFSFGISPESGPTLVFEVFPTIFAQLHGGMFWSILFFFLLFLASLTSTISMSEISITYFMEEYRLSRLRATMLTIGIATMLGLLCALSFGPLRHFTVCGMTIFNLFDYLSSNILLPLGGMLISIFAGWIIDKHIISTQLSESPASHPSRWIRPVIFCLRYVAPVGIALIFMNSIGII